MAWMIQFRIPAVQVVSATGRHGPGPGG